LVRRCSSTRCCSKISQLTLHQISTAQTMFFYVAAAFVKISICLFNRRLTGLRSRGWMICHNVMLGLISCFILALVFGEVFKCSPPLTQWGFLGFGRAASPPTHCLKAKEYGLALSVLHIIFDFALLSVPLIVLGKMRMSTSKRIRLVLLFSVGSVSCIGSVMRQVIAYQTSEDATCEGDHSS